LSYLKHYTDRFVKKLLDLTIFSSDAKEVVSGHIALERGKEL
jgi:hypothetical protein